MSVDPLLGEIMPISFNFAPRGWALCDGALLAIASNTALFSLLGTSFGGDGRTSFALPDLRGRSMRGVGNGPGLPNVSWGQQFGATTTSLSNANMPPNLSLTATLYAEDSGPTAGNPEGNMLASHLGYAPPNTSANKAMASESIVMGGSSQEFNIGGPSLGLYACIATEGTFPSRT